MPRSEPLGRYLPHGLRVDERRVRRGALPLRAPGACRRARRLRPVLVDAHSAIAQEQIQRIPLPQRVRNRHSQRSLRRSLVPEAVQFPTQLLHARSGGLLTSLQALVRIAAVLVGAPLDLVKLLNQLQRARRAQVTGLECSHEFPSSMRQTSCPLGRALLLKQAAQARVTITLKRALKVLQQLLNMRPLPVRSVLKEYDFIVADKRPDMPALVRARSRLTIGSSTSAASASQTARVEADSGTPNRSPKIRSRT